MEREIREDLENRKQMKERMAEEQRRVEKVEGEELPKEVEKVEGEEEKMESKPEEEVCGEPEEVEKKPEERSEEVENKPEEESKPEETAPQTRKELGKIEISESAVEEVMKPIEKKVKEVVFYYWPILPTEHCLRWKVSQAAM